MEQEKQTQPEQKKKRLSTPLLIFIIPHGGDGGAVRHCGGHLAPRAQQPAEPGRGPHRHPLTIPSSWTATPSSTTAKYYRYKGPYGESAADRRGFRQ